MIKKYFLLFLVIYMFQSCSNNDNVAQENNLKDILIDVVFFEFTPDTGNNSFRLQYEIKFTNPNNKAITGFYTITTTADGLQTKLLSTQDTPCYKIEANDACTVSFDSEESFNIARINSIVLDAVTYTLEN